MSEFRILDANYCFESATAFRPTSEDPAFPATNLAKHSRSKVWRSYGFFRIQSTNKYLDFNDNGGSELNAVLTEGEYTTAELETAIELAMVAAGGAGEYEVSFSRTTGKWTISTDQTEIQLLTQSGANTANSIAPTLGFDAVADYAGDDSHLGAFIALHTEERMVIDLENPELIDSFAMVFDPDLGHKFSQGAVIKLQASAVDYWYGAPEVDVTLTFDDVYMCITHFFASAQNYRYWSVKIVDPQNPYLYIEIPKVLLAKATQLGQLPQIGFSDRISDQSKTTENEYGHSYSDIYPNRRSLKFNYQVLSEADFQTLVSIEGRLGGVVPIGVCLDPMASVFDKDRFFIYGRLSAQSEFTNLAYTYFNTDFSVEEAF